MKRILTLFLYLLCCSTLYSQVDSSAASFFPSSIGNVWRYQQAANIASQTTLTRDSIVNGSRYLFFDTSHVPAIKIDSQSNIITDPDQGIYEALQYKLRAKRGDTWISEDTNSSRPKMRVIARVDDVYWGIVIGTVTQIKKMGYYYQPITDTTYFNSWRNDDYLASGFGLYMRIVDASQSPDFELIGCIINGKKYGTVLSANYFSANSAPLSYKLYPAFPNPFNPSTTLSYYLPSSSTVKLSIYTILGNEIATLIDDFQEEGLHTVRFEPKNLSSGMYVVRLVAGNFTTTNKVIYSK